MVALRIGAAQIIKQASALANHFQQSPTGTVVFDVGLQVLGQFVDACGEHGNLYVGRPGVLRVELKLFRDFGFLCDSNHDVFFSLFGTTLVSLAMRIETVKLFLTET